MYFDQSNPTLACQWLSDGIDRSQGNVELQNQLQYLNQRCAGVSAASADSTSAPRDSSKQAATDTTPRPPAADTTPKPPAADTTARAAGADTTPPAPAAGKSVYRVQIAAVGSKAAASDAERKARALGLTVVTVHEKNLYKVRAGHVRHPRRGAGGGGRTQGQAGRDAVRGRRALMGSALLATQGIHASHLEHGV